MTTTTPQSFGFLSALNRAVRSLKCVSTLFGSTCDMSGSPSGSPGFGGGTGPNSGFFSPPKAESKAADSDSFSPPGASLSGVPAIPGGGDGFVGSVTGGGFAGGAAADGGVRSAT